ncbi:kunitz-type protease inhibitor 2 [Anoplopoma fimbria]|uniref:kunitz-type protease inhibitor 2 n=1 Tax=Anoplopoma fimbria TaxID=229290 RepID=UPI0023EC63E2|nr:kunitz-type protease inhibitor 2 [Anoplopoma fimbria]
MDRLSLLALCLLVCTGQTLHCDWDQSIDPDQGLDLSLIGAVKISEVPDPESCRAKCCADPACDLAQVSFPQDGTPLCLLVGCLDRDRDVCVLRPGTQSKVYRKKGKREADREPQGGGERPRVVPLMESWKPESNQTKNQTSAADYAEHCGAEPQVGPCRAAFQHWYYNSETGSCQSFIYGGCRGNKNNYVSKESCMATCAVRLLPSSKKGAAEDEVSTEYKDDCMATSDPGPCRAAFPMFYHNPNTGTCQSFIYGGCGGNQNRYGTMDECLSRCRRDGSFDHRGKVRDRWTAAVFLFVTLAAISALLLVSLVVITLRRHSLFRRPSSISDKEELLPDPDEQSSLESLAIPESPKPDKV